MRRKHVWLLAAIVFGIAAAGQQVTITVPLTGDDAPVTVPIRQDTQEEQSASVQSGGRDATWLGSQVNPAGSPLRGTATGKFLKGPTDDTVRMLTVECAASGTAFLLTDTSTTPRDWSGKPWRKDVIQTSTQGFRAAAIGDGDNDGQSELFFGEINATGSTGTCNLYMAKWNGTAFVVTTLYAYTGVSSDPNFEFGIMDIVVGDPNNDGLNEVVWCGNTALANANVMMETWSGGAWVHTTIQTRVGSQNWFGIDVGDWTAYSVGREVVTVGYTVGGTAPRIQFSIWNGSAWTSLGYTFTGWSFRLYDARVADISDDCPTPAGLEVALVNADGVYGGFMYLYDLGDGTATISFFSGSIPVAGPGGAIDVGDFLSENTGSYQTVAYTTGNSAVARQVTALWYDIVMGWYYQPSFISAGDIFGVSVGKLNRWRTFDADALISELAVAAAGTPYVVEEACRPEQPILAAPVDGASNVPVAGWLHWRPAYGAASYDVYPSWGGVYNVTDTCYEYTGLAHNTPYSWYVVAINGYGTSTPSATWNFTTAEAAPAAFNLLTPANHATGVPVAGNLTWEAATGATTYDLFLGTSWPPPLYDDDLGNVTTYAYSGLTGNETYYWAVEARNANPLPTHCVADFDFTTEGGLRHDVGCTAILAPAGNVMLDDVVFPKVTVENFGEAVETFMVEVLIEDLTDGVVYQQEEEVVALGIGESRDFTFVLTSWTATPAGAYKVTATTRLAGDAEPLNDAKGPVDFSVIEAPPWPAGWVEMTKSVPTGTAAVKDGGWLVTAPARTDAKPVVYVAKGNKSTEFYSYDPYADTWRTLAPIIADEGGRPKPPKKGCNATTDGVGSIYMTKGNNTPGFWKYDIQKDSWYRLPGVPLGADGKKVKGGTDLAYVAGENDTDWVYLMKGYKTAFYRYNVTTSQWDSSLTDLPYTVGPKYNAGSFLVYDNAGTIYAHQAKYTDPGKTAHYMYKYDLASQTWLPTTGATGMPVLGMDGGKMKNKKSKDGGAGAWYDGSLYALKGGNTCQFYRYSAEDTAWAELDTIKSFGSTAKKKKVKGGGDLTSYGLGAFFALKGNKTYEFWRYVTPAYSLQPTAHSRSGVQAGFSAPRSALSVSPNPLNSGYATIRYSLPKVGPVTVNVLDVAGRSVLVTRSPGHLVTGSLPLDLRKLSNGVYLVRLDADGYTQSQKLVVQR